MIDFHAHILPAADHGSDSLATSLAQLKLAEDAGIHTLIATPHFYPQVEALEDFLERRQACWQELTEAYHGRMQLLLGAEVHMCAGIDHMEGLEQLCVSDTNVILLELGFGTWTDSVTEAVCKIQEASKLFPVLAHIDRYPSDRIDELLARGIHAQLNGEAFCRLFGKRKFCDWIDSGSVVALGSDIHGTAIGYKNFLKSKSYLKERFDTVMRRSERVLSIFR